VADVRHVCAELMGATGYGLERQPRKLLRRGLHDGVISDGMARAFLTMLRNAHERVLLALLLGEKGGNPPLMRFGYAGNKRPIDLSSRAGAEGLRECSGGKPRLCDQKAAGRVFIEPMHQPQPLGVVPDPPCTASPIGLFRTSTSASS